MFRTFRVSRYSHWFLFVMIGLLCAGFMAPRAAEAATKQQEINNALDDFKNGQFQRASLANVQRINPTDKVEDKVGAVQLGPIGLLKNWTAGQFTLPKAISRMGATAIGTRIFIIGGLQSAALGSNRLAEVWSVGVSPIDGALLDPGWQAEPPLIKVQGSSQPSPPAPTNVTTPTAEIHSPAVTSIQSDASGLNGYIYVIGGNARVGIYDFSSFAVRIGTVVNGHITGWQEQLNARIPPTDPNNPFSQLGAQSAVAVSHKVGGVNYVYLIGGLQHYYTGGGTATDSGLKTVFYARVGSGGKLYKPSSPGTEGWDKTQDIPVPGGASSGLWDASASADTYVASNLTAANAIFVIGGQTAPNPTPSYSATAYRATIAGNGALTWDWTGTMPTARSGAGTVSFRGNLYVTGGQPNGQATPDRAVLTSYVEDNLTLHQFTSVPPGTNGNGTNFLQSDVLLAPRTLHGTVIVPAGSSSPNSAFVYVLGGIGPQGSDTNNAPRDTIIYGKIGGSEDISLTGFASDGWFYSTPFNVAAQFSSQIQVQEIDWTAVVTRTTADMDIALDYRLSLSNNCSAATWGAWTPLDGAAADADHTSVNGQNIVNIANPTARCLQYRAYLTTDSAFATPLLLNVSVKIIVPGNPDLSVASFTPRGGGSAPLTAITVVLQNKVLANPQLTLPANFDRGGSFFVDMCIFGPGEPVVTKPLPWAEGNTVCSDAYANVDKSLLGKNATFTINTWYDTKTELPVKLTSYFAKPGTYKVVIAVDSFGYVDEGTDGGENNNLTSPYTIIVSSIGDAVMLPLVRRS